ncbi:MAG: Ldh family oxidoreductase [Hyphomicrobiaceae bacterium]|nr:Ldh family oxidoreductase [Hyphomicrobiaceae bacterium]
MSADQETSSRAYPSDRLVDWLGRVFQSRGLDPQSAATAAGTLVRTNARGIETHGLTRVLVYVQKLGSGEVNAMAAPRLDKRHGLLHYYADGALGQSAGMAAVDAATASVRTRAAVTMIVHEVGHLAALGMFVLRAAEQGMIALLAQSTPPVMGLIGSRGAAIGNNPLAFASPVPDGPPLVFDIAASGVARGNVVMAARAGRPIPEGWAIDEEGRPTTDAEAALRGAMLPMAGHKGIGLAMMVECLAGSLSGAKPAAMTGAKAGSAPSRVGAFLTVINPELALGREAYLDSVRGWIGHYKTVSGADGRYPGERAAQLEAERRRSGIPLPPETVSDLARTGEICSVPFDVEPIR